MHACCVARPGRGWAPPRSSSPRWRTCSTGGSPSPSPWRRVCGTGGGRRSRLGAEGGFGGGVGVATCLTSPLGGLFLALAAATLFFVRPRRLARGRRKPAAVARPAGSGGDDRRGHPGAVPRRRRDAVPRGRLPAGGRVRGRRGRAALPAGAGRRAAYLVVELRFLHPLAVGVDITGLASLRPLPVVVAFGRLPVRALVAAATAALLRGGRPGRAAAGRRRRVRQCRLLPALVAGARGRPGGPPGSWASV